MTINRPENASPRSQDLKRLAAVSFQAGCLTFAIAGVAILAGFLLDARAGSSPKWTLIFLIGSAPFSLGAVFLVVRRAVKRFRVSLSQQNEQEEAERDNED
jgi:F0F1-type ATP synthase assembly protein I